ncbi:Eukaryotic translation initiation factor 3 subunit I [Neolecta irregularis DAH-3]|uniref:Eukaryotic translation initiation factor 3 subunit I n=1 Tax=Neolecta irregularis (strain DAH-3) TaxID=1198029 RepID=A0A1U7LP03_NEOID|nr:Eukaryotic translation initiation factor 3 subunit I [Neolecta irregularis DAH-3]|eukprot:OLL24400.1 Eukaryotic translation initiation factor 3 subunit I [Neolecta irregularis DAH-3]
MKPILLQGHERSLTQIIFNKDGDLLFSVSKDTVANVWFYHNGERLGTYSGHNGAIWSIHVNSTSTIAATGSADNSLRLWEVQTGRQIDKWEFPTAIKRVEFRPDDSMLLGITEQRMGYPGSVIILPIVNDLKAIQASEPLIEMNTVDSKATVAGWSYDDDFIITGHEDGSVSKWDWKAGKRISNVQGHEKEITDLQFSPDRTYFITASKDKTAMIYDSDTLEVLKTYLSDTPLNTAAITPIKDFIVVGGGQEARDVTTTLARQGKFEARFYHKIFSDEIGRIKGHFGPLNTIAVHPDGIGYASGGEDGYVRVHQFDKSYFDFAYEVERREI